MSDEQKILDCFGVSPLSLTTIGRRTGLSRKRIYFLIKNYMTTSLKRVDPTEVGSGKKRVRVFGRVPGGVSVKAL